MCIFFLFLAALWNRPLWCTLWQPRPRWWSEIFAQHMLRTLFPHDTILGWASRWSRRHERIFDISDGINADLLHDNFYLIFYIYGSFFAWKSLRLCLHADNERSRPCTLQAVAFWQAFPVGGGPIVGMYWCDITMRLCSCTKRMEHQPTHINTQLTTQTAMLERSDPRGERSRTTLSCTKLFFLTW